MHMELSIKGDQQDKYSTYEPSDAIYKQIRFDEINKPDELGYDKLFLDEAKKEPVKVKASLSQSIAKPEVNSRVGFSNQASEYRKAFYHFQRLVQSSEKSAQQYNNEFQKNLTIKTQNILDLKGMSDFFERQLFKLARNPKQLRKNWSEDETLLLLSLVAYFCCLYNEDFMNLSDNAWQHLETMYPGKTSEQIKLRWQNILKVPLNKAPWSKKEDEMLEELVKERGANHWREIALELHSKSGSIQFRQSKQCRERWTNHLDPSLKKGSWKNQEDLILLKEFLLRGKRWSEIAKKLPGRTENSVKNRWISLLRKYKSEMTLQNVKLAEEFEEEDAWHMEIAKTLIEVKERGDFSEATSEGFEQSLVSEEKTNESAEKEKDTLDFNLKNREFAKQNKFIASKMQESFDKMERESVNPESFCSKNPTFVAQDSFKDLIEWQKATMEQNKQQQQQQQTPQQLPPQQTFLQQQQFQQIPQQQYQQQPLQNSIFAGVGAEIQSQSSMSSMTQTSTFPQTQLPNTNQNSMYQTPNLNQNFNPYAGNQMMGYPGPYNPQPNPYQSNPYQPMYYPGGTPFYPPNSFPQMNWGTPMYGPNYGMNQLPYHPQFQPQFQNQYPFQPQFQYPQQQQPQTQFPSQPQPQFQTQFPMQTQYQFQPQIQQQPQLQPQKSQEPNTPLSLEPQSTHQFREVSKTNILDSNNMFNNQQNPTPNSGSNPNSNYYFSMVDMNKKEIFFMDQVTSNNYNKIMDAVSENSQYKPTENLKLNDEIQNQGLLSLIDNEKKYDRYMQDFP